MAIKVGAIIAVFKLLLMLEQSMLNCNTGFLFLFSPNPVLINKLCCASTPLVVSDFKIHYSYSGLCKSILTHGIRNSYPKDIQFITRGGGEVRTDVVVWFTFATCAVCSAT